MRNSGRVFPVMNLVSATDNGTVNAKISTSFGEMTIIMKNAPTTVIRVVKICMISFASEVFTVSISYEMRLMISPVWCVSKYPTGSSIRRLNTSLRI